MWYKNITNKEDQFITSYMKQVKGLELICTCVFAVCTLTQKQKSKACGIIQKIKHPNKHTMGNFGGFQCHSLQ